MSRFTFVVRIRPDGPSTLENLSTQERVPVEDLAAVGHQIESWLASLSSNHASPSTTEESSDRTPDVR